MAFRLYQSQSALNDAGELESDVQQRCADRHAALEVASHVQVDKPAKKPKESNDLWTRKSKLSEQEHHQYLQLKKQDSLNAQYFRVCHVLAGLADEHCVCRDKFELKRLGERIVAEQQLFQTAISSYVASEEVQVNLGHLCSDLEQGWHHYQTIQNLYFGHMHPKQSDSSVQLPLNYSGPRPRVPWRAQPHCNGSTQTRSLYPDLEHDMDVLPRQLPSGHVSRLKLSEVPTVLKLLATNKLNRKQNMTRSRRNLMLCHPRRFAYGSTAEMFVHQWESQLEHQKVVISKAALDHLVAMVGGSPFGMALHVHRKAQGVFVQAWQHPLPCPIDEASKVLLAPFVRHCCTKAPPADADIPTPKTDDPAASADCSSSPSKPSVPQPSVSPEATPSADPRPPVAIACLQDWPVYARSVILGTPYYGQQALGLVSEADIDGAMKVLVQEDECDVPCVLQTGQHVILSAVPENLGAVGIEQPSSATALSIATSLLLHPECETVVTAHVNYAKGVIKHLSRTPRQAVFNPVINQISLDQRLAGVRMLLESLLELEAGSYMLTYQAGEMNACVQSLKEGPSVQTPLIPAVARSLAKHFVQQPEYHVPFTFPPQTSSRSTHRRSSQPTSSQPGTKRPKLQPCQDFLTKDGCSNLEVRLLLTSDMNGCLDYW
eukprot:m.245952 g.245952  ORF g.245952 m.245952 type:complete len:660 (+) comp17470_c0_seq9:2567-4546(+)